MDFSIKNYFNNDANVNTTAYTSKTDSASFQDCYSSIANAKIAEKELYDELKSENNSNVSNVEFGSKEWESYIDKAFIFPPLNAPREVSNAWQEVKESIPKDDKDAQQTFRFKAVILAWEASHPADFGLPANFQLNTVNDYETLFNNDININEGLEKLYKNTNQEATYEEFVKLMQDVSDKLNNALSKYQSYL